MPIGPDPKEICKQFRPDFNALLTEVTDGIVNLGITLAVIDTVLLLIPGVGWLVAFLTNVFATVTSLEFMSWARSAAGWFSGGILFVLAKNWPNASIDAVGKIADEITCWTPAAVDLAAMTMQQITGIPVNRAQLKELATETGNLELSEALGGQFMLLVPKVFDLEAARKDMETRSGISGSTTNLARFMGTNLNFQLRSLTISTISSMFGWEPLRHLEGLHQSINWAFGFGWMSWAVMSEYMNVAVNPGLRRMLNSKVKHVDFTAAQAVDAWCRGIIDDETFRQCMDNDGVRNDIRNPLVQMHGKKLTEGDLTDLYEHGELTLGDVHDYFRIDGYLPDDAVWKNTLVRNHRLWQLQKELYNVWETQFAHGLVQEQEFRTFLGTLSFDSAETDIEIEIAKRKASLVRTAKPKGITGTFNVTAPNVKAGGASVMTWNIHNATRVVITDLGEVEHRGERIVYPQVTRSYYLDATSDTDSERFEAVVVVPGTVAAKRPTLTFSASPNNFSIGQPVELKWTSSNADTVVIDQVGAVPEAGVQVVYPFVSTIYTIRATNAQGTTVRQDAVFVKVPSLGDLDKLLPKVSFTISPGVVKAKQPRAEMKWIVTDATKVELVDPDGVAHEVGKEGLLIITATKSDIWELKATNAYGTTNRHEAIIWTAGEEDEPPVDPNLLPPQLSFTVSPQTAKPGEDLFIYWSIQLAPTGTLVLPDGTTRIVGVSGSQTYKAPMIEGNYEFRLQSVNQNGPSALSMNVVVSTAQ